MSYAVLNEQLIQRTELVLEDAVAILSKYLKKRGLVGRFMVQGILYDKLQKLHEELNEVRNDLVLYLVGQDPWIHGKELYEKALLEGSSEPRQIRVMLCGPFGVGKSSIARSLQHLPFDPNLESTEGIDIAGRVDKHEIGSSSALSFQVAAKQWKQQQQQQSSAQQSTELGDQNLNKISDNLPEYWETVIGDWDKESESGENPEPLPAKQMQTDGMGASMQLNEPEPDIFDMEGISLMLWDFAGQIAYHSLHQMFFRENCLYVLVLNLKEDTDNGSSRSSKEKEMLHYAQLWLNAIVSSAGPNVGMVVVGTHADYFASEQEAQARLDLLLDQLKERTCDVDWDQVVSQAEKVVVDNKNCAGLKPLKRALISASKKILSSQDQIPLRWLRLLEALDDMELPADHFCLSLQNVAERAFTMGFSQESEVIMALSFFDRVGSLIYVPENALENWVFPEPHQLLHVIKTILAPSVTQNKPLGLSRDQWNLYSEKGVLSNEALSLLWKPFQHHSQLRQILAQSNLLMDLGSAIVVPSLLPEGNPDCAVVEEGQLILEIQTLTECSTHLPPAMFPFLLAGMHRELGTEEQDLELMGRTFSILLVNQAKGGWDFPECVEQCYIVLVADQLQHTISMTLHLISQEGNFQQLRDAKDLLTKICAQTVRTQHDLANSRFPWMTLRTMVQTGTPCNGITHKWCFLETNKAEGTKKISTNAPSFVLQKESVLEIKYHDENQSSELQNMGDQGKTEFDIFVSHSGEQKLNIALPLHQQLVAQRFTPFIDKENLPIGVYAPDIMEQAMKTAPVGIFVLSPEFVSKEWPMKELLCFLNLYDRAKARGTTPPLLIPVFHSLSWNDCGVGTEALLETFQDSFSNPLFKFWERVKAGETSPECVAEALKRLKRFSGVENRYGDAQIVTDTANEVRERRAEGMF